MTWSAGTIFSSCIGFLLILPGIYGICKIKQFLKGVEGMARATGLLCEYSVVQKREEDGFCMDYYYPVYDYWWMGELRKLHSNVASGYPYWMRTHTRLHIYLNTQTGEAVCLEDQIMRVSVPLTIGGVGVVILILTLLIGTGVISPLSWFTAA